jgi:hypothetical protein
MRTYSLLMLAPLLATVIVVSCGSSGSTGNVGADTGEDGGNGSSSGSGSSGGSGSSSGSSGGSGSSSGASGEDAGTDAALPKDASVPEICTHCVQVRCDTGAQTCEADPTCAAAELAVEQCISECPPSTDCSYCSSSASAQVLDLYDCLNGACVMPCENGPATSQRNLSTNLRHPDAEITELRSLSRPPARAC